MSLHPDIVADALELCRAEPGAAQRLIQLAAQEPDPRVWRTAIERCRKNPSSRSPLNYFTAVWRNVRKEFRGVALASARRAPVSLDDYQPPDDDEPTTANQPPTAEAAQIWAAAQERLRGLVNDGNYETFLADARGLSWDGVTFTVAAPNAFIRDALAGQFHALLIRALADVLNGPPSAVAVRLAPRTDPRQLSLGEWAVGSEQRRAQAGLEKPVARP